MTTQGRPIGYWLRTADQAITADFERTLATRGLTRFHWQVLNLVADAATIARSELLASMRAFVDRAGLEVLIQELADRGWLTSAASLALTDDGRSEHAAVAALVQATRLRLMQGTTAEEYQTVVRVLERMIGNLGAADAEPETG